MPSPSHPDFFGRGPDPGAELRRLRPRTGWALGERERRAQQAVEQALKPVHSTARTIALEQLAHVRELTTDQSEPLVIDLVKLADSDAAQAAALRSFTDDIVSQRRSTSMRDVVFFREEDLAMLAGLLRCEPLEVTGVLETLDVLAG